MKNTYTYMYVPGCLHDQHVRLHVSTLLKPLSLIYTRLRIFAHNASISVTFLSRLSLDLPSRFPSMNPLWRPPLQLLRFCVNPTFSVASRGGA